MPVSYDFRNRAAVVTGGSNGIGRSIAQRLQDAGALVTIWDLVKPDLPGVSFAEVDISRPHTIDEALSFLIKDTGTIDILVNNAGYHGPSSTLLEFDPVEWRRIVEINLIGVYEVCRRVVPLMKSSNCGRVVNMSSMAGKDGSPLASAYAAAKAGVIALTKSFGKELANTNVLVNAIVPATIQTGILSQLAPEEVRRLIDISPMKRLGTVDEVAELTLWLCSEACSFSTGATFDISGGRAVY